MRIGQVAAQGQVSIQTLRYYERRGLFPPLERRHSGYRVYGPQAVRRLRFIKRAQDLGFTLDEIADLLAYSGDPAKSCRDVEHHAATTLERIDGKLRDLRRMRRALGHYVTACRHRQKIEECPLLKSLGGSEESP